MKMPSIAIVMPAYNEAHRIEQTLGSIAAYRAGGAPIDRVIVSDDGSDDDTAAIAQRTAEALGLPLEVLHWPHRGKALAVRDAMLDVAPRVEVDYLMMLDADDELRVDQLDRVAWTADPRTVYIGRRVTDLAGQPGVRPTLVRRAMSTAMRTASRTLLGIRFPDTQCGFKLFPRRIAADLFGQQRSSGWTFDAELLYIVDRVSHLPVVEVPVVWTPRGVSRVRPAAAALSGIWMFGTALRRLRRAYRPVGGSVRRPSAAKA
jgi:glycosyltransferase involved in cell wall biosynthesis